MHNIKTSDLFIFYLDLNMWQIMAKIWEKMDLSRYDNEQAHVIVFADEKD